MIKKNLVILFISLGLLWGSSQGYSQDFDYRLEESPAISWNGVPLYDAGLLASGGISLLGSASLAALSNPALTMESRKPSVSFSTGLMSYRAYQYWGVNQGVLKAPDGIGESRLLITGLAVMIPLRKINLSMGWAVSDILDFPDFNQEQYNWGYSGFFEGKEDRFFLSIAFPAGRGFHLGVALEYEMGYRQVDLTEHYYYEGGYYSLIQQQEQHHSRSFGASLGALIHISPTLKLGVALRYPLTGEVDREIIRRFGNNFPSPDIQDEFRSTDDLSRPPSMRLGVAFSPFQWQGRESEKKITLAAEGEYVWWSGYEYLFFGENLERNMRNTLSAGMGLLYSCEGASYDTTVRAGFRLDTQPPDQPRTTLKAFCLGVGLRWKQLQGDIGMSYITGSAGDITQNHFVLCATLKYMIKGE